MKKIIAVIAITHSAAFAVASTYQISFHVMQNNKLVSQSSMIVSEGQKGMIANQTKDGGDFFEVTPSKVEGSGTPMVMLDMKVGRIDPSGERTVVSQPRISTIFNERASIAQYDGNWESMKVEVVVKSVQN